MRKFLIPAALLASTVAISTPAAAQWAPPVPQGYAYGYQNNYGQVRRIEARIQQIRRDVHNLEHRRILTRKEARRLDDQASDLQRRARIVSRNGLSGWEMRDLEVRVQRLQQRVAHEARDGRRYGQGYGYNGYQNGYGYGNNAYGAYGTNSGWSDRDRDGRDDRYEDDRGRDHDGRRDHDDD